MAISKFSDLDPKGYYTYDDYMSWTFPERVELYRGKPQQLSPGPNRRHQEISTKLQGNMFMYFNESGCFLYSAPFDVRLPVSSKPGKVDTVVQPDLCVICDKHKLDKQGCNGAPDLVVEILSPGNPAREIREKFDLYQASGVKEYWLVQPPMDSVVIYVLNDEGKFIGLQPLSLEDDLKSGLFPGLVIPLRRIFTFDHND